MTMNGFDRVAIAARIRGLIAGQDGDDPAATAARLGVDEVGYRMSIDELSPNPTIDVVAAVVLAYGVDPSWLLTGIYDSGTHRHSLEDQQPLDTISRLMLGPPGGRTPGSLRLIGND